LSERTFEFSENVTKFLPLPEGEGRGEGEATVRNAAARAKIKTLSDPLILNWEPAILGIMEDIQRGKPLGVISTKFHNGLVEAIVAIVTHTGEDKVVLTGGCFHNKYLLERSVQRLAEEGFNPYWHHRIPPNDAGIAPGQIIGALRAGRRDGLTNRKEENVFGHSR